MLSIEFHDLAAHDLQILKQDGKRDFVVSALKGLHNVIQDEVRDGISPLNEDAPEWHYYIHAGICIIFRYGQQWFHILMIDAIEDINLQNDQDFRYKLRERYRLLEGKKNDSN